MSENEVSSYPPTHEKLGAAKSETLLDKTLAIEEQLAKVKEVAEYKLIELVMRADQWLKKHSEGIPLKKATGQEVKWFPDGRSSLFLISEEEGRQIRLEVMGGKDFLFLNEYAEKTEDPDGLGDDKGMTTIKWHPKLIEDLERGRTPSSPKWKWAKYEPVEVEFYKKVPRTRFGQKPFPVGPDFTYGFSSLEGYRSPDWDIRISRQIHYPFRGSRRDVLQMTERMLNLLDSAKPIGIGRSDGTIKEYVSPASS